MKFGFHNVSFFKISQDFASLSTVSKPTVSWRTVVRAHRMNLCQEVLSIHMGARKFNKTTVMWPVLECVSKVVPLCSIPFMAHSVLTDGTDGWWCGKSWNVKSDWSGFSLLSHHWTILLNHHRVNGYNTFAWTTAMPNHLHANTFSKWENHMQLEESLFGLVTDSWFS